MCTEYGKFYVITYVLFTNFFSLNKNMHYNFIKKKNVYYFFLDDFLVIFKWHNHNTIKENTFF